MVHDEQALVIGSFYSMNGLQQCVEGLIAYSIAHIEHAKLKSWQIIFTVRDHLVPHSSSYMACVASGLSNCCLWLGGYQIALYERNASSQKIACFWQSESVRTTLVSRTGVQVLSQILLVSPGFPTNYRQRCIRQVNRRADVAPRYIRAFIAHMVVYGHNCVVAHPLDASKRPQETSSGNATQSDQRRSLGKFLLLGFTFFLVTCLRSD